MKEIWLDKHNRPAFLQHLPKTLQIRVIVTDQVELIGTAWSGGSKNAYTIVDITSGHNMGIGKPHDELVTIPPGQAITCYSEFRGKAMPLRIYMRQEDADKLLLPQQSLDLTDAEQCLLEATAHLKANYGGRKQRIDMMHLNGFDGQTILEATNHLKELKLLMKNGAITPAGRNQRPPAGKFKS